jgi:orotate phosphoribosyltransferase
VFTGQLLPSCRSLAGIMTDVTQMTEEDFLALFKDVGADLKGHFILASGKHSDRYFDKKLVFRNEHAFNLVATAIAHGVILDRPNVIVAPQSHGVMLAERVRTLIHAMNGAVIPVIPAEKNGDDDKGFHFKPEHANLLRNRRAVIIEDILTTGGSVEQCIGITRQMEAEIIGLHMFVNRGKNITAETLGIPKMTALAHVSADDWTEEECPVWLKNIPVNETVNEHGRNYMDKKRAAAAKQSA